MHEGMGDEALMLAYRDGDAALARTPEQWLEEIRLLKKQ